MKKPKVLPITNIPNAYPLHLFNELNRQLLSKGIELKVVFGAAGYERRKFRIDMRQCDFPYVILPSRILPWQSVENTSFTYRGLLRLLRKDAPSLVITNAFSFATMKLWLRSLLFRTPYIIWSGAIRTKGLRDTRLRFLQRQILIHRAKAFIAYGTRAKRYLIHAGADPNNVYIGINTVDTEFFSSEAKRLRNLPPAGATKRLLYVGYLEKGKRLDQLFNVFRDLLKKRSDVQLDIVGTGPEESFLRRLAESLDIADHVNFAGFIQKENLPPVLAQAACFLFPSEYDIWGLVLVEAMVSGIPCVSSIHAGATDDLIQNGDTGYAVDFSDTQAVAGIVNSLLDNPGLAADIGNNARNFISQHVTIKKSAEGFVQAIVDTLAQLDRDITPTQGGMPRH